MQAAQVAIASSKLYLFKYIHTLVFLCKGGSRLREREMCYSNPILLNRVKRTRPKVEHLQSNLVHRISLDCPGNLQASFQEENPQHTCVILCCSAAGGYGQPDNRAGRSADISQNGIRSIAAEREHTRDLMLAGHIFQL